MRLTLTMILAASLLVGCGKDDKNEGDKGGGEASGAKAGGDTPADKPADKGGSADEWKEMELAKLGLVINAPGDAKESSMGGISAMNYKCSAMINEASDMSPPFENFITNIEKGNQGGPVKEMVRKEKTDDDNFVIEYSTDKKWGFQMRKKIGDKVYSCGRVSSSKEGHDCVVKVCESMKAKG